MIFPINSAILVSCLTSSLFHHQVSICTENVKFREVTVDLLPGTTLKVVPQKTAAVKITHPTAYRHELRMF